MSSLFGTLDTTKLDKADVVDPSTATEDGKAADAKSTYEELTRISGMASDAKELAESKADQFALEAHVASTNNPHSVTAEQVNAYTKETVDAKLDEKADIVGGKIPASQLPSYVDDVLEYDTMSAFPVTGEGGKIYVAKDTNLTYRWSGTQYVEISPSPVLDDAVTEKSPNGVKSSGIWSWVKSLLPKWLTSNYAEPATVASVEAKADKATTLAGYGITDAVPFVDDANGAKTAVTIGSRKNGSSIGIHSIADGLTVTASGEHSHAEGGNTTASVYCSHSEGFDTTASGEGSHAEGDYTSASERCSHAEGLQTGTYGNCSHAEGEYSTTSGEGAHAEGYNTNATGKCSHAEGFNTNASGEYSHAEGENTIVSGNYSHAEGSYTTAPGKGSHAEGNGTTANGEGSHAEGSSTTASGTFSHAEGVMSQALSEHSFAFVWNGDTERAATYDSHGAGTFNINPAGGLNGFYIGEQTLHAILANKADNATTLAGYGITDAVPLIEDKERNKTAVTIGSRKDGERVGEYSFANGSGVTASGSHSHAEGGGTTASGSYSHAEGVTTTASGEGSHAEGIGTTASGNCSHAEGTTTTASGNGSHAEGADTIASGQCSHASGTKAQTREGDSYAYVWNGDNEIPAPYTSNGPGTFSINPVGGMYGFYIGEQTLDQVITAAISVKADKATTLAGYGITDAVPFVEDASGEKTAVTIGSRVSNKPVGKYSLVNGDAAAASGQGSHAEGAGTTASGQGSHAEGNGTTASGDYSHAEGTGTTASGYGSHAEGDYTTASGGHSHAEGTGTTALGDYSHADGISSRTLSGHYYAYAWNGDEAIQYSSHGKGTFSINPAGGLGGFYIGEQTLEQVVASATSVKADRASIAPEYSATSAYPVGAFVYHDGNIYQCKTAIADGGEAWNAEHWELSKLDDFFTESNSLLTGTIDARLPYPLYAVPSTGLLKDRAINTTSLASVTVPENFTDLLIRATVASSLAVTMPVAIATKYGDTFPGEAGEYLITITKTGAAEAFVRTIKLEEVANA